MCLLGLSAAGLGYNSLRMAVCYSLISFPGTCPLSCLVTAYYYGAFSHGLRFQVHTIAGVFPSWHHERAFPRRGYD